MPYTVDTPADQCREVHNGFRCVLGHPHDGEHFSVGGAVRWPQAGETVTLAEVASLRALSEALKREGKAREALSAELVTMRRGRLSRLEDRVAALEMAVAPASDTGIVKTWDAGSEEPPRDGRYVDTEGFEWTFQDDAWGYWHDEEHYMRGTWDALTDPKRELAADFPWERVTT